MTTIADSMQNAAQAVTDQAAAYQAVAGLLNNEIGTLAQGAGLDPTKNIGSRFLRAVRSGQLQSFIDVGTVANVLVFGAAIPHTALLNGMPFTVQIARDVTGPTQVQVNSLPAVPLHHVGGGEFARGDYKAGDVIEIRFAAGAGEFLCLTPINGFVIDKAVTKTVHGAGADFVDLNAFLAWMSRRRISSLGSVAAIIPAGQWAYGQSVVLAHPDAARITINGAQLTGGGFPGYANMAVTGPTASVRASDTANNLILARNRIPTELRFINGASLTITGSLGTFGNVLVTSDGTNTSHLVALTGGLPTIANVIVAGSGGNGLYGYGCSAFISGGVWAFGCAGSGILADSASAFNMQAGSVCYGTGNAVHGVSARAGGAFQLSTAAVSITAGGNAGNGLDASDNGTINCGSRGYANLNGANGFNASSARLAADGSTSLNNTGYGFFTSGGRIGATNSPVNGNGSGAFAAIDGGFIAITGWNGAGAVSPAVNTAGNSNSYIRN